MSTPSPNTHYDWTFYYELSRLIFYKDLIGDPTIKFAKDSNDNLKGFNIIVNDATESNARKISEIRANNLLKILIIKSGMDLNARLTGDEGIPKTPGRIRVGKTLTIKYNIEGVMDKIDLANPTIRRLINQYKNPDLEYLSNAVTHINQGRHSDSIKEGFKILENNRSVKDYFKYKCIRNILSHKEGQQLHQDTMNDFIKYFGPNVYDAFDFKQYDGKKRLIILDFESSKTKQTLEKIARDLIREAKSLANLPVS